MTATRNGTGTGATVYSAAHRRWSEQRHLWRRGSPATLGVYYAFIQFAGFTMGKAVSAFDAPWANYPGNNFDGLVGGSGTITGVNQFTYTAQFGNGVSAAISAAGSDAVLPGWQHEHRRRDGRRRLGGTYGANNIGGTRSRTSSATVQGRPGLGSVPGVGCRA